MYWTNGLPASFPLRSASALKHQADTQDTEFASRSELAINGMAHRNRAVDGDIVVVRLLPRHLWTTMSSNLLPSEAGIFLTMPHWISTLRVAP